MLNINFIGRWQRALPLESFMESEVKNYPNSLEPLKEKHTNIRKHIYLVQGTSADILNERLIEVHQYLHDKKSNVLLQVHDEIICEIHDSEFPDIPDQIAKLLEQNSLDIPLFVDKEVCFPSWANKTDFTKWMTNGHHDDIVKYIDWGD